MTREEAYQYGRSEGREVFPLNRDRADLAASYAAGRMREFVGEILADYGQIADTIYYSDVSDSCLMAFERGFHDGFRAAADEHFKAGQHGG